jgi:hypothetical protein
MLWDSIGASFLYANREENNEYRDNTPCTSVVYHNQLWNFAGVVFGFHAERNTKKQEEASPCLITS